MHASLRVRCTKSQKVAIPHPFYNLGYPTFKTEVTVSDAEFDREYRTGVKTFVKRDHAIKFAYHCNLDTVTCPVYDDVNGQWVYNAVETGKIAAEIN